MAEAVVETIHGRVRGVVSADGIASFKGIPYAGSPAGSGRFLPPPLVTPWNDVREATAYAPSCPQPTERPPGWSQEEAEDEDCLALNIWTPAVGGDRRRPVMVWIHGGLFTIGSGSWPLYNGAALAKRGDVVVVTVNHRLGALGYLHLDKIGGTDYKTSGNAGMLDLVAALEWVRENIAAFGGDPNNVTLFGESGGGAKISILLAMPSARGLFHRAAIQSGPGLAVRTSDQAAEMTGKLLAELGIEPSPRALDGLRATPAEQLVAAQSAVAPRPTSGGGRNGLTRGFGPELDGIVLPEQPGDALAGGKAADVPVLIGCNRDEGTMMLARAGVLNDPKGLDEEGLRSRLSVFGERAEALLKGYRKARPDDRPLDLLIAIHSDSFMRMNTIRFAERKIAGSKTPTYMYLFCWAAGPMRSAHGFEIAFVFDNVRPPLMEASESRTELADRMSEAWLAFARSGDPNHRGLPEWPPYSVDQRPTMIFDRGECKLESDPFGAERRIWGDR